MKNLSFLIVTVSLFCFNLTVFSAKHRPYCIGADVSWVQQQENEGLSFKDKGVKKDVLTILSDNGFNWIRLRLFVDPKAANGYSKEGYCDLEHTLAMAKRVKTAGMKLLLDFHYSDTWADPGKQFTPSAWDRLKGRELDSVIFIYTKDVLTRFKKEGLLPEMVQIGNEINHGMMWPEGKTDSTLVPLSNLLRSAAAAVRTTNPKTQIMIHLACGGQNKESVWFLDRILKNGVDFDVVGQSYYPEYHGTIDELKYNLTDLATRYRKPIVVVEYQVLRKEVNEIVLNLPNQMGLGTFIWEATSPRWGNLFDKEGNTTESMQLYPELSEKFKNRHR
ncbi:MAG TPA: glycosyl hydrolase 53 family protein [Bacteroidales bacterium]|nr:glycosyl hydrolase 53 family protein [Bacteroidales bacterium]